MQKLLIMSLILSICLLFTEKDDYTDITELASITSIAFEQDDKELILYAYFLNDFAVSKSEYNKDSLESGITILIKDQTIENLFDKLIKYFNITIDFTHLNSLILHTSFINKENIITLTNYILNNPKIYPDFNLFFTCDNISDLYKQKQINSVSSYFSLITKIDNEFKLKRSFFIDLVNTIYEDNYFQTFPSLSINLDNEIPKLNIDGIFYLTPLKLPVKMFYKDFPLLFFLNAFDDLTITYAEKIYLITKYRPYKVLLNHHLYYLYYLKSSNFFPLNEEILSFIKTSYHQGLDFLNLKYLNIPLENLQLIPVIKY